MDAQSIMNTNVVTVAPEAKVEDIASTLLDRRISAVPVVSSDGSLVGIVSEGDLMRRPEEETEPRHSWWLDFVQSTEDRAAEYLKTHGRTAKDVMTQSVVTVEPGTPVAEIAETLERRHIKRVPVVKDGKLVGIVSRADLLRALAVQKVPPQSPTHADDRKVRDDVLTRLRDEGLPGEGNLNPVVTDGVVHLWGHVESSEERDAVALAASSVDGVTSVVNNLAILDPLSRAVFWAE